MSDKDTGGAAFPHASYGLRDASPGMTLRDYFAAKAMYAMCREDSMFEILPNAEHEDNIARAAYAQADAMLQARKE